jgi:hypothetical protein
VNNIEDSMHFFTRLVGKKQEENLEVQKNTLYLNEKVKIILADSKTDSLGNVKVIKNYLYQFGCVIIFFGGSGSGKTYSSGIIADQIPTVTYLDPTGAFYEDTLKQQGVKKGWKRYRIGSDFKNLQINANEISKLCTNIWAMKARSNKPIPEATIRAINRFLKFSPHARTFRTLRACFEEDRKSLPNWEMISKIVSRHDDSPSLMTYFRQKSVIEEESLTSEELAFFLYNLYSFRRKLKLNKVLDNDPSLQCYFTFQDESADAFKEKNPVTNILDIFASQGRKYFWGSGWITPYYNGIPPSVRTQKKIMLIHQYDATEFEKLRKIGIVIDPEIFQEKSSHYAFLVAEPRQKILFDNYEVPPEDKAMGIDCPTNQYYRKFVLQNKPKIRFKNYGQIMKNYGVINY